MLGPHTCRCVWNAGEQQKEEHPPSIFSEGKTKQNPSFFYLFSLCTNFSWSSVVLLRWQDIYHRHKNKRVFTSNYKLSGVMHNRYGGGNYTVTRYLENWDRPHLPAASEVCFLRIGDLEKEKMAGNHAMLLRYNTEFSFLTGNCNAAASASSYGEFPVLFFPPQTRQIIRHPA